MFSIMPKIPVISVVKTRFGSVQPEYSGPPLKVIHSDRLDRIKFVVLFLQTRSVPLFSPVDFTYVGNSGKEFKKKKWWEPILLVGPVWSENAIPFSSVSPAVLWPVALA